MGLSMSLTKKHYIGEEERETLKITGVNNLKLERVSYIIEEVGKLWKVNAVHRWFVEHVQDGQDDCKSYYVSPEKLQELLHTVNAVIADPRLARQLLPTMYGQFFGGTAYDENYFYGLRQAKEALTAALADESCDIEYSSSW